MILALTVVMMVAPLAVDWVGGQLAPHPRMGIAACGSSAREYDTRQLL
jgi:hypothetical protein